MLMTMSELWKSLLSWWQLSLPVEEEVRTLKSSIGLLTGARAETGLVKDARAVTGLLPISIVACGGAVEMGR